MKWSNKDAYSFCHMLRYALLFSLAVAVSSCRSHRVEDTQTVSLSQLAAAFTQSRAISISDTLFYFPCDEPFTRNIPTQTPTGSQVSPERSLQKHAAPIPVASRHVVVADTLQATVSASSVDTISSQLRDPYDSFLHNSFYCFLILGLVVIVAIAMAVRF